MSDETLEQDREIRPEASEAAGSQSAAEGPQEPMTGANTRLVPVVEAIKYRRRAQQAETRLQQVEQQLNESRAQLESRLEQLGTAEAQRDELQHQLDNARRRSQAERMLHSAGVGDTETAMAILEKRADFSAELEPGQLEQAVAQLLQDKAFLTAGPQALPGKTASARPSNVGTRARIAGTAARAAKTGNRRDVAEYLRLRRQAEAAY